jgi:hypothetical protein
VRSLRDAMGGRLAHRLVAIPPCNLVITLRYMSPVPQPPVPTRRSL